MVLSTNRYALCSYYNLMERGKAPVNLPKTTPIQILHAPLLFNYSLSQLNFQNHPLVR